MRRAIRQYIKGFVLTIFSMWICRKTKMSKVQSEELASCLMPALIMADSWSFRKKIAVLRLMFCRMDWKKFNLSEELVEKELRSARSASKYREPIGAWFTIDSENDYSDSPKIQSNDDITYYASGREPLLALANQISTPHKVVLLPYFTCVTVFQPFVENGWELVHYRVSKNLKIDTKDVKTVFEKHRPSMAVFMEYAGLDLTEEELEVIGELKRAGCLTVVDRTQNIYSRRKSKEVDFYMGSLRKWFCCPDGAYLERNGEIPLPPVPAQDEHNDVYATACGAMMFTAGLAKKRENIDYITLSRFFRRISASYVCEKPVRTRNMSEYSKAVYLQESKKDREYTERRMRNCEYIFKRVSSLSTIRPACSDIDRFKSAPLYFHIYTKDRRDLSRYLYRKGIVATLNWPRPSRFDKLDEETEFIFHHILSLPCDQRYTEEDMKIMCDALEAYESAQGRTADPVCHGQKCRQNKLAQ